MSKLTKHRGGRTKHRGGRTKHRGGRTKHRGGRRRGGFFEYRERDDADLWDMRARLSKPYRWFNGERVWRDGTDEGVAVWDEFKAWYEDNGNTDWKEEAEREWNAAPRPDGLSEKQYQQQQAEEDGLELADIHGDVTRIEAERQRVARYAAEHRAEQKKFYDMLERRGQSKAANKIKRTLQENLTRRKRDVPASLAGLRQGNTGATSRIPAEIIRDVITPFRFKSAATPRRGGRKSHLKKTRKKKH